MTPGQRMTAMSAARGSRGANEFYLAQPTGYSPTVLRKNGPIVTFRQVSNYPGERGTIPS
jgi:hypothetical protein